VFPVRYELGFYIAEDGILHSYRRENVKSYRHSCGHQLMHDTHAVDTKAHNDGAPSVSTFNR
jgi:hypothetical protein